MKDTMTMWQDLICQTFKAKPVGDAQDLVAGHCRQCDEDFAAYMGDAVRCECGASVPAHDELADPAEALSVAMGAVTLAACVLHLAPSWLAGVAMMAQGVM